MNLKEYYKNCLNELMEQEARPGELASDQGIPHTYPPIKWDPLELSKARDSGTFMDFHKIKGPEATPAPLRDSAELIRSRSEEAVRKFKTSIGLYPTSSAKEGEEIKAKAKSLQRDRQKAEDEAGLYDVYKNLGGRTRRPDRVTFPPDLF